MNRKQRRAAGKQETLGDGPIESEFVGKMTFLAREIDHLFNGDLRGEDRNVGFALMVFKFGDAGRANYMSNANRDDVITLLKEQLARFEGQSELKGTA
jgi:hypothetical protein